MNIRFFKKTVMFLCFLNWWNQSFDISHNWTQFIIRIWPVYTTRAAAHYYRPPLSNYLKPQIGVKKSTCLHTSNLDPDHLCLKLTFLDETFLAFTLKYELFLKHILLLISIEKYSERKCLINPRCSFIIKCVTRG